MKNLMLFIIIFLLVGKSSIAQAVWFTGGNICPSDSWKLVFHDEFDGTTVDINKWYTYFPYDGNAGDQCAFCRTHDTDKSQQIYLDQNLVVGNGTLKIIQKQENASWFGTTANYTSGVINSKQEFSTYSKFEIRCKIPSGAGFWSAFWTFGWNTEIDVFEFGGQNPNEPHMSVHDWSNKGHEFTSASFSGHDYSQNFHVYAAEYDPFFIKFYINGQLIHTVSRYYNLAGEEVDYCNVSPGTYIEQSFYPNDNEPKQVIANVAVATNDAPFGLSAPNAHTTFPNQMEIDYIRVYQRNLQGDLDNLCPPQIQGNNNITSTAQTTYSVDASLAPVTWTVSSNLQIISQSPSSVTVKAINSSIHGAGWIGINQPNGSPCPASNYIKDIHIINLSPPKDNCRCPVPIDGFGLKLSEQVHVFPNPAAEVLNIRADDIERNKITKCVIVSKNSDIFQNIPLEYLDTSIDIAAYPVGMYYVIIETNDAEIIYKPFVIERN